MMEKLIFGRTAACYEEKSCINTASEIAQQPEVWMELADMLLKRREEIGAFMDEVLKTENLRIVLTGAGSSAFIGETFAFLLGKELGIRAENVHTTDIVSAPDAVLFDVPTLLISYARSGESPESIAAVKFAGKRIRNLYQAVIVCDKESSLAKLGYGTRNTLVLDMPEKTCDKGFAMTSSVSTMSLATWCLFHYKEMERYAEYVRAFSRAMGGQIDGLAEKAKEIAGSGYRRLIWLGSGALKGLGRESAVKTMELTNGYVHAGYDAPAGFRHGPKTVINEETLTVHFISNLDYTRKYDVDLANEVIREKHGNQIVIVRPESFCGDLMEADYEAVYRLPEEVPQDSEMGAYLFSLVFAQLLAMEKSLERGCTTDNPCPKGDVNRVVKGIVIYNI